IPGEKKVRNPRKKVLSSLFERGHGGEKEKIGRLSFQSHIGGHRASQRPPHDDFRKSGKLFLRPVIEGEGRLINFLLGRFASRIPIAGILDKKHVQTRRVKKGKKIIQILYHL